MALFVLSYDLRNERIYQPLYNELARFGAVRVLESCWCFNYAGGEAVRLREHFRRFMDGDDGVFVAQIANINDTSQWAGFRLAASPNQLNV